MRGVGAAGGARLFRDKMPNVEINTKERCNSRYKSFFVAALIAGVAAFYLLPRSSPELTRAEFMAEIRAGHVHRIEVKDQEVIIGESSTRGEFRTEFDRYKDVDLPAERRALGIEVLFSESPPGI